MKNGINFFKMDLQIQQKEIYLVPFPFSNFSQKKVRPILVLSNNTYNKSSKDVIVCAITRNISSKLGILFDENDLIRGTILTNSAIKIENICFIDKKLVIKQIAILNDKKFNEVKDNLLDLF